MKSTKFGKIPVKIRRLTNGDVIICYEPVGRTITYGIIDYSKGYLHKTVSWSSFRKTTQVNSEILTVEEAKKYLKKYCDYHRADINDFKLVSAFSRELTDNRSGKGVFYNKKRDEN